jgi:hypothetical protein
MVFKQFAWFQSSWDDKKNFIHELIEQPFEMHDKLEAFMFPKINLLCFV